MEGAPPGCVGMESQTQVKTCNGVKTTTVTTKYTMADGSTQTNTKTTTER